MSSMFSLSGSTFLCRYARFPRPVPAPVVEVRTDDYVGAQEISHMTIGELDSKKDETPRPKKKMKAARKDHSTARAQASVSQYSSSSSFASQEVVCEEYCFRKELEAVPQSVWSCTSDRLKWTRAMKSEQFLRIEQ